MKLHVPLGQFPKSQSHSAFLYVLKTSLLYTRCLPAVNVTCIKSNVGLLQTAHSCANAGVLFGARVGRRVAFETIKLIHAKVLCTIFDINYHPNIAHINMQGASVLVLLVKNPYIRAQTSGQLTASDPIRTTHENIAIYCGQLPAANCLFFVKKTKGQ